MSVTFLSSMDDQFNNNDTRLILNMGNQTDVLLIQYYAHYSVKLYIKSFYSIYLYQNINIFANIY